MSDDAPTTMGPGGEQAVALLEAPPPPDEEALTAESVDRYESAEELGRGGIGRVVRVHDRHLDREVAVKELLQPADAQRRARFLREARITGRLEHPNIVPVHELGLRPDGTPYYTMRRVRGETLALAFGRATEVHERLALIGPLISVCQAVAYAHSRGVVHRDLKPHNVMLAEFGEVAVLDWGLAKVIGVDSELPAEVATGACDPTETALGQALGTPAYMSPEQARGEDVDRRADVWALGVLLRELLSGEPPFRGHTTDEVLDRLRSGRRPWPPSTPADVPRDLLAIADRATQTDPARRYPDAGAMASELVAWQTGRQVGAYQYGTLELLRRLVRRNPPASLAAALAVVALLVATVLTHRAYRTAEASRAEARAGLSTAYLERARQANARADHGAAAVFAAAALVAEADAYDRAAERARGRTELFAAEAGRRARFERRLPTPDSGVAGLAFSPDGRRLAAVPIDGGVWVWTLDGACARPDCVVRAPGAPITRDRSGVAWMHGGQKLAIWRSGHAIDVLRADDLTTDHTLTLDRGVWSLAARPGGGLAVGHRDGAQIGSRAVARSLETLSTESASPMIDLAWSPDGRLLAGVTRAPSLVVWDATTGARRATHTLTERGEAVAFVGDRVVATGKDNALWSLEIGALDRAPRRLPLAGRPRDIAVGGQLVLTGTASTTAVVRDPETLRARDRLHGSLRGLEEVAISPDGARLATAGMGPGVGLWTAVEPTLVRSATAHAQVLGAVVLDGDRLYTTAGDLTVRTWRLGPGGFEPLGSTAFGTGKADAAHRLAISPSGGLVAVSGIYGRVSLLDPDTGEVDLVAPDLGRTYGGWPLAFSEDGRVLYFAGADGALSRWSTAEGRLLPPLEGHKGAIWSMAVSGDGRLLASGGRDGKIRLWDRATGVARGGFDAGRSAIGALGFSPAGDELLVGDTNGDVSRRSLYGEERARWAAHPGGWVNAVGYGAGGSLMLTAGDDATVRVWERGSARLLVEFPADAQVRSLQVTDDGTVVHDDGTRLVARRLDPELLFGDPDALLRQAEAAAGVGVDDLGVVRARRR